MKKKNLFYALPIATIIAVSSCKKADSPPPAAPAPAATTAETSSESSTVETPAATIVEPTARASKLGFAQMLPTDLETLILLQNGQEIIDRVKSTKLWKDISSENTEASALLESNGDSLSPSDIFAQEFFFATGKGTATQTGSLVTLNERVTYHTVKSFITATLNKLGKEAGSGNMASQQTQLFVDLLNDPKFGASWLTSAEMPPIYLGCKTTSENADLVKSGAAMLASALAGQAPFLQEFEFQVSGHSFKGVKISGEEVVKMAEEGLAEMTQVLGEKTIEELLKAAKNKNIIIGAGSINGYELLLIGSRPEDFLFAATPADSFAASKKLAFVDPYLDKKQVALLFSDQSVLDKVQKTGGLSVYCDALRDGLAGNQKIDTREVEALLEIVSDREKELLGMNQVSDYGAIALLDDGFRIETFGGTSLPCLDTSKKNKLGALGEGDGIAMFANWTSNPAYDNALRAYFEAFVHTAYSVAKTATTLDIKEESFMPFKQYFAMFDQSFLTDATCIWTSLTTKMSEGLGSETAMIVDLKGEMPAIPGIPQELVKDGVFPRISAISPVVDRSKLADSWKSINASSESIVKKVSEMMQVKQAMPKPMSSTNNDLTTWFFPAPLFTDDFAPSITVSDKWFVASSSKKHAGELAKAADASNSGHSGAYMTMDFGALTTFGEKWLTAIEKNKDKVFAGKESVEAEFTEAKDMISSALKAVSEFEKLNIHVRKEAGVSRSTLHFKTK